MPVYPGAPTFCFPVLRNIVQGTISITPHPTKTRRHKTRAATRTYKPQTAGRDHGKQPTRVRRFLEYTPDD
jgi:hypothetical protein